MQRSISRAISLVTAVMLMLFSATSMGAADRPLKLKGTSVVHGNPFAGAEFTTSGTGTHLGRFTGEGVVLFTENDDPDFPIAGAGEITFIAANGDELDAEFNGLIDDQGNATIDFTITGGTGRFSDAEGSFQAVAESIPADSPTFSFTANGRISY
jgi:hypothetical protein